MSAFQPLTDAEQQMLIEQVAGAYRSAGEVPCTGCRYCMDCPVGVNIPKVFLLYNRYKANQKEDSFQEDYGGLPVKMCIRDRIWPLRNLWPAWCKAMWVAAKQWWLPRPYTKIFWMVIKALLWPPQRFWRNNILKPYLLYGSP